MVSHHPKDDDQVERARLTWKKAGRPSIRGKNFIFHIKFLSVHFLFVTQSNFRSYFIVYLRVQNAFFNPIPPGKGRVSWSKIIFIKSNFWSGQYFFVTQSNVRSYFLVYLRVQKFIFRWPSTENDLRQKTSFDGRQPATEDDLQRKTTSYWEISRFSSVLYRHCSNFYLC